MKKIVLLFLLVLNANLFGQIRVPQDTLNVWYKKVYEFTIMHNYDDALFYCDMLLANEPSNCKYIKKMADINGLAGNEALAEQILLDGLKYSCDSISFYLDLSTGQLSVKNYVKAHEYIDRAIKIKPDSAELHLEKADIFLIMGEYEKAILTLQDAKHLGSIRASDELETYRKAGWKVD